ncbi:hypothetical protein COU59_02905 [Candidatus Pacearchaeota archaeon CG10_big_fil_rev_8_21_14_0_10_34_12]|nr:MAG: hypothetical protein COU59_02905 [Candidatus Pacearchaeota archaeon CG10_big_fil_rev_8_21_14_0_10_34_12]
MAKKSGDENELLNSAIQEGVASIVENHPRFRENEEYILRYINSKKLNARLREISEEITDRNLSEEEQRDYIKKEIADYVSTGAALDDRGKEIILKSGLEEKAQSGFFRGFFARRGLEGEKYLDNVVGAFQDLYSLFKQGDYAQRMPEVAKAVGTVYDMGFLDPAVEVLRHYGLIDKGKYKALKQGLRKRAKESAEAAVSGIGRYAGLQKATASVFGIVGISVLIASGLKITGNIIGNSAANTFGAIAGIVLIVLSFLLFSRSFKN